MNQSTFTAFSHKLSVDTRLSVNPLLHFYGQGFGLSNSKADVELPLKVLTQSVDYRECWFDGSEVVEIDLIGTKTGKAWLSDHHLVVVAEFNNTSLHDMVVESYQSAYRLSEAKGFQHVLRTWNYLDRINEIEDQEERYQTFCVARHEALAELGKLEVPHPAATAIGGHHGKNLFVFLFAKQAGRVIENKRQVSAWNYPKQYAPKQPRFSRAMQCGTLLMCSGTASVLGHKTIHLNDVSAQFEECLKNVSVLLTEDVNQHQIKDGIYRFYLREAAHTALIESKINELGIEKYSILHSDVCRENLLIECEVVFQ